MDAASKVNYRVRSGESVQGFYTLASDGTGYGFENVRSPKVVLEMLQEASSAFTKNPPPKVAINESTFMSIFSKSKEPSNTKVVRVFTRVRPIPVGANSLNKSLGRDHLWIVGKDIQELTAAGASGSAFKMPHNLLMRIVRYNLIDNVRGQPDLWEHSQVKQANIVVSPVGMTGKEMNYKFTGDFSLRTDDGKRGLEGTISGEITTVPNERKLARFRAFADATAWGDSKFTAHAPSGRFPLVIAMLDVDDSLAQTVAPDAISLGDLYFAPSSK
jgi:hypothetical protein